MPKLLSAVTDSLLTVIPSTDLVICRKVCIHKLPHMPRHDDDPKVVPKICFAFLCFYPHPKSLNRVYSPRSEARIHPSSLFGVCRREVDELESDDEGGKRLRRMARLELD